MQLIPREVSFEVLTDCTCTYTSHSLAMATTNQGCIHVACHMHVVPGGMYTPVIGSEAYGGEGGEVRGECYHISLGSGYMVRDIYKTTQLAIIASVS